MALQRHVAEPAVLLLLLLVTAGPSLAQQSNGTSHLSHTSGGFTTTTVVVLVVLISAFVLLTLFSIYINRCAQRRPPPPRRASRAAPYQSPAADGGDGAARTRGLDKETVESFPTAVYGDVKARVSARPGPLECAVCLAVFEDDDELRVLPACCHVFHPDCIDPWLAGAVTCPLCRADLSAPTSAESCELTATERQEPVQEEPEEQDDEACLVAAFTPESVVSFGATRPREFHYRRTQSAMEMPDRHTLRLPEHVMRELAAVRRHRRAASLAGYPDAVERTPRWLTSFWRSMSWQRQSRMESDDADAAQEHGGSKRVVPITGVAPSERPSGSGSGGDKEKPDFDALNRV